MSEKVLDVYELNTVGGEFTEELIATARKVATPGKGILAADESTGTIGKRFAGIDVENNQPNRIAYRELIFSTPNISDYISGAILYEETFRDSGADDKPLPEYLTDQDIVLGIKVDKGLRLIPGTDEYFTQGITNLGEMCAEFYALGARFAKWRAVYRIGDNQPSQLANDIQSRNLAMYAALCQANGLVPIVEPEVLMDGEHDIQKCAEASERVYANVVRYLHEFNVLFEGMLLKPNMILPGAQSGIDASPEEVAWYTVRTLRRTIPASVPGIMFLSGGQSEEQATRNLNAINQVTEVAAPWVLSFSFGRALQSTVLKAWQGDAENKEAAQNAMYERAKANGLAQLGQYLNENYDPAAEESLYQKNYVY